MASNRQCRPHHEDGPSRERQNRKGGQGVHAGMRQRIHLLHHQRGFRKVPAGEAQDGQWRGHSLCHDFARVRKLLGSPQDLPVQVSRNPPRKSEQATHWAVCSRARRAQRRRLRESTACTECRIRNGRRHHGLWISSPQRKRSRVLGELGSDGPTQRGNDHQTGASIGQRDDRDWSGLPKYDEETERRNFWLGSDCWKCASMAHSRGIYLGVMRRRNRIHVFLTRCRLEVLFCDHVRMLRVGRSTHERRGYLYSSYLLDYYWSRFFPLCSHGPNNIRYVSGNHTRLQNCFGKFGALEP